MVYVIPLGDFVGLSTKQAATRVVVGVKRKEKKGKNREGQGLIG